MSIGPLAPCFGRLPRLADHLGPLLRCAALSEMRHSRWPLGPASCLAMLASRF